MATPQELEKKFWKAVKSDMTMMIGLDGIEDGHARPMTAQFDGDRGPIWFFTAKDNGIVRKLGQGDRAIATFASKSHDPFATVPLGMRAARMTRNSFYSASTQSTLRFGSMRRA
jgi:general stress protein 26